MEQLRDSKKWETSNSKPPGPINPEHVLECAVTVANLKHLVQKYWPKVILGSKRWKILPFFIQNVLWSVLGAVGAGHVTVCTEWSSAQKNYAKGLAEKRKLLKICEKMILISTIGLLCIFLHWLLKFWEIEIEIAEPLRMGTEEEGERANAHVFQYYLVPKFPCSLQMEAKNPLLPICKHFPPLLLLVGHGRSVLMLLLPFSSVASNANSCCCRQSGSKEKRVCACCPLCCCFCSSCCFYFVNQ